MDQNMREAMRMGFVISTMELAFKLTLERLAKEPGSKAAVVDEVERELMTALRNAKPTENLPDDLYVALVDSGVAKLQQACSDVRRTLGITK